MKITKSRSKSKSQVKDKEQHISKSAFTFPSHVLEPVKSFLSIELEKLTKRKVEVEKSDPFKDKTRIDDNAAIDTDAAEQFGHARVEAFNKHLEKKIIQVRKALSRIKIGRYGVCERCGQFIDTKRLTVFPETTICIKCEKEKES